MGAFKNLVMEEEGEIPDASEFCDHCSRPYENDQKVLTRKGGGYYCSKECKSLAVEKEKNEKTTG